MAERVLMPKQGNTVESCVILEWKKREGDSVAPGDILCEVETDKAAFEIAAEHGGTLLRILHGEGEDVPVLQPIAYIGEPGEAAPVEDDSAVPEAAPAPAAEKPAVPAAVQSAGSPGGLRPRISPRARNFAAKHGVAVDGLPGSGPGGRILESDVRKALEAAPVQKPGAVTGDFPGPSVSVKVDGFRAVIARRMRSSLAETAQLTLHASADARDIIAYRERLKRAGEESARAKISLADMVMYAAARVLKDFPALNAHFLGDTLRTFGHVHLAFAVDTPKGLLVPTIRYADTLSLGRLSAEKRRLAEICLSGRAGTEELIEATFTVTNLGSFGVEMFTPVLNPPQTAILGICSTRLEPVMENGRVVHVPRIGLSLTIDHQAVDGAPAARFLASLSEAVADFQACLAD